MSRKRPETRRRGTRESFSFDTAAPDYLILTDREVLARFFEGHTPTLPTLTHSMFPDAQAGEVVVEGEVHFAMMGARSDLECDSEYLRTDKGDEYFDNILFRGILPRTRVRVIKTKAGFRVEEI